MARTDNEKQRGSRRRAAYDRLGSPGVWTLVGGSVIAAAAGYLVGRRYLSRTNTDTEKAVALLPAPALAGDRPAGFVGSSGNARQAGADQMRDPPAEWDKVDESLDETYPASDPAPAKHIT